MKKLILTAFIIFLFLSGFAQDNQLRQTILLDTDWQFIREDIQDAEKPGINTEDWETVEVPHDWAIKGPFDKEIDKISKLFCKE